MPRTMDVWEDIAPQICARIENTEKKYTAEEGQTLPTGVATNVWQKNKLSNSSHGYDPFCEDKPGICVLEMLPQIHGPKRHYFYGQSFDMSDSNAESIYSGGLSPTFGFAEWTLTEQFYGHRYDPKTADGYFMCRDATVYMYFGAVLIENMGREQKKRGLNTAKHQQGERLPLVHVDSMEDTLSKLQKTDAKAVKAKPRTLNIPKSSTTSSIGVRDGGGKTPSGAFRPIKSDPELGTKQESSRETATQCGGGRSSSSRPKSGFMARQGRTMSMPEAPSKGKLRKLQSQLSSVFKKRESYPHDGAYARYSRKRYVSSSSSSSDTSPLITCTSYPSSPELDLAKLLQNDDRIDIDVDEIEKEVIELGSEIPVGALWMSHPHVLSSEGTPRQDSQEEFTETEQWVVSPSGEYMYIETKPSNKIQPADHTPAGDSELPKLNNNDVAVGDAALTGDMLTAANSSSGGFDGGGGRGGVSGRVAQLQPGSCTSLRTSGTMNYEFQLKEANDEAATSNTVGPWTEGDPLGAERVRGCYDNDINHAGKPLQPQLSRSSSAPTNSTHNVGDEPECPKHWPGTAEELTDTSFNSFESAAETLHSDEPGSPTSLEDKEEFFTAEHSPVEASSVVLSPDPAHMLIDPCAPKTVLSPLEGKGLDIQINTDEERDGELGGKGEDIIDQENESEVNYSQHIAASLVNNSLAIMLLIDHKLSSGCFHFSSTPEHLAHDDRSEDGGLHGDIDAVPFQYEDPDENLEEDNLLMAKTFHYMRRQAQELDRSKSFGNTVSKAFNEAVSKLEMGHDSRNKQFHKLFPCVPDTEAVINSYSCALVKDILLQGRLFISENWICFHSNIFTYEKQIAIRLETVTKITKERTAFVVPNAIGLHTPSEKHIFGSLLSRHSTHQLLYRVWKNAKGETESMSPESSLQGESDDEDIPGDSDEEDSLDGDCDGQNGRVLSSVSVHERLDPGGSSMGGSRHGSPRQPRMTSSDLAHSMGELSGQRHRSRHHGYHHQLSQMLCSVSIFKSIKRIGGSLKQLPQYQPFLFLIGILLLCLTVSAAVLTVRIWRLQPSAAPLAPHAAPLESVHLESMGSIGDLFLTEQHRHQEKVSNIQDTLTANLKALLKVQNSLRDMRKSAAEESSILAAESESSCLTEMGKEDL